MSLFQTFKFRRPGGKNVYVAVVEHRPAKCSVTLEVSCAAMNQKKVRTFKFDSIEASAAEYERMIQRPEIACPPGFERV